MSAVAFPLSAIVAQEQLIEALLVCAVAPEVGGVLVRGDRGTAKTTAVRALAAVLEPAPLVELPLGTTLDRLVGSIDVARALAGEHAVERGILSRADGGILYVDEVNLLGDHLIDALLDAAATGVVRVEREGVSAVQDARFILVGTMNPEEGELRPQLLDRFGLGVEITTPSDPAVRAEIVTRRLAFEANRTEFVAGCRAAEAELRERVLAARERLPRVVLGTRELTRITVACASLGVDGVRGDIVTARASRALAALDGVDEVTEEHVRRAAILALGHRRRRDPLDPGSNDPDQVERALDDPPPAEGDADEGGLAAEQNAAPVPARIPHGAYHLTSAGKGEIDTRRGSADVAVVSSLVRGELREHIRSGGDGALVCLIVDASGSMGARKRSARVKGALLELLRDAYARRDEVAVVAFRDAAAEVVVAPGAPIEQAAAVLRDLPTGGRTPLASGLETAVALITAERRRRPERRIVALVLTDGRVQEHDTVARAAEQLGRTADLVNVVDLEEGPVRLGLAATIAGMAGGGLFALEVAA